MSNLTANPTNNWMDIFDKIYLRHNTTWTVTLITAYLLVFVVGIIGNSLVISVVVLRQSMRTVTNFFIFNLAVADLLVIVFCIPTTLISNIFIPWILGSWMCKLVAYIQGVSVCASAYSLAAISWDRCVAILRPLSRPPGLSKGHSAFILLLIWLLAASITIPWAVVFNVTSSESNGLLHCVETWGNSTAGLMYYFIVNLICYYLLPLQLIVIANTITWCTIARRKVPHDVALTEPLERLHQRTRQEVTKMLATVTMTFLLSWLPLYGLVTFRKLSSNFNDKEESIFQVLLPAAQWLGSMNSCVNPILYAFMNTKFRNAFKGLFPSWISCITTTCGQLRDLQSPLQSKKSPSHTVSYRLRQQTGQVPAAGNRKELLVSWYRSKAEVEIIQHHSSSCFSTENNTANRQMNFFGILTRPIKN